MLIVGLKEIDPDLVINKEKLPVGYRFVSEIEWDRLKHWTQEFAPLCDAETKIPFRYATEEEIQNSMLNGSETLIEIGGKKYFVNTSKWNTFTIQTNKEKFQNIHARTPSEAIFAAYKNKDQICCFDSWSHEIENEVGGWGWIQCDQFPELRQYVCRENMPKT